MSASASFDAFISYSTIDKQVADAVKQYLQSEGVRCWKAPDDIDPGRQWPEQIANAIDNCSVMVLVWSLSSMQSREVAKELTLAMSSGLTVIPLRLEDIQPEGSFKYHLSGTHWLDTFDRPLEQSLSDLSRQVQATLSVANKGYSKVSKHGRPSGIQIVESDAKPSQVSEQDIAIDLSENPQMEEWREHLWWLLRGGNLRAIDKAALGSLRHIMSLDVDIDKEVLIATRNVDMFASAILEFCNSDYVDDLSAIGLDTVRKASCISKKEAQILLTSQLANKANLSVEGCSIEWISDSLVSDRDAHSSSEIPRGTSVGVTTSESNCPNSIAVLEFAQCVLLNEADLSIFGWWDRNFKFHEEIQCKIKSLLVQLDSTSGVIQGSERITPSIESKVCIAHGIKPGQYGRLLLRVNTSTFSGKNGVLVFERLLSLKDMWENASHYYYCDTSKNQAISLEITSIDNGFSLVLNKISSQSNSKLSSKVHTFSNVSDWNEDTSERMSKHLPPLVKSLSDLESMLAIAASRIVELERILDVSEVTFLGNKRVLGYDFLILNENQSSNAAKHICNSKCDPSDLFLVIDSSMWDDCKEGLAFSKIGVHQKDMFDEHKFIPWSRVTEILPPTRDSADIWINDIRVQPHSGGEELSFEAVGEAVSILELFGILAFASTEWLGLSKYQDEFRDVWLGILADAYHKNGYFEHSLAVRKMEHAAIGCLPSEEQDEKLLSLLSNLSGTYASLSMDAERICCQEKLLEVYADLILRKEGEMDHEERLNELLFEQAQVLSDLGRYHEAIAIRRRELEWCRKTQVNARDTMISMHGLGCDLLSSGATVEALDVLQSCLQQRQKKLGASDDDTLTTMARVLEALSALDKQHEGLALSKATEVTLAAELGDNHPKVLTQLGNQASLHEELGDLKQAEALQRLCLSRREEALGADHPDSFSSAYNLAEVLSQQERHGEAIPLRRRELAWCRETHGDTDEGTLTSINALAIDLRETGVLEEAEALFRELLAARLQVLEPDDFLIGRSLGGLAKTLEQAGKLQEAAAIGQEALDHRLRHEGPDAWWTNRERMDQARVLHKLGRSAEALTHLADLERSIQSIEDADDHDRQLLEDALTLRHSIQAG